MFKPEDIKTLSNEEITKFITSDSYDFTPDFVIVGQNLAKKFEEENYIVTELVDDESNPTEVYGYQVDLTKKRFKISSSQGKDKYVIRSVNNKC